MIRVWARALRSMTSSPCAQLGRVDIFRAEDLHPTENGLERRSELVGEGGEKFVFQAALPFRFPCGGLEFLGGPLLPRDVARNLGSTDHFPVFIPDRGNGE